MSSENALVQIQNELKVPKSQFNKFGNYNYRSCEDILEALKPILLKYNAVLTVNDEIVEIQNRIYVKATATVTIGDKCYVSQAFAREEESKKGMDGSQVTGAASSYARKYALNGLFLIDDNKDNDTNDKPNLTEDEIFSWKLQLEQCKTIDELNSLYRSNQKTVDETKEILEMFKSRKNEIGK